MTIKQICLLSLTVLAAAPIGASQKNNRQQKNAFVNNGALVNQGTFVHYGAFQNNGLVVNAPAASFHTGNIPHPQYERTRYTHNQNPQQQQYLYTQQIDRFYSQNTKNTASKQSKPTVERTLTDEEQKSIAELKAFRDGQYVVPQKFEKSIQLSGETSLTEQLMIAQTVLPRMKKYMQAEGIQITKPVVAPEQKQNSIAAPSLQKTDTDHPLFFYNKEESSLFRETPNTVFVAKTSPKKLFYTTNTQMNSLAVSSVCDQLQLNEGQAKSPIHAAAFGKWTTS
jgi:hypothetical protein